MPREEEVEEVERWYHRLPRIEKSQPLVISEGVAYTPEEVVSEVRGSTPKGEKLKRIIAERRFTAIDEKYALATARLRQRLARVSEQMPHARLFQANGESYTASEMLDAIEAGSGIARVLVDAEVTRVEEVLTR